MIEGGIEGDPVRVVLVGEERVGKTALISQLLNREFPSEYRRTRDFQLHFPFVVVNERLYPLAVADVGGIDSLPESSDEEWIHEKEKGRGWGLRSAEAYLLVFDLSRPETFTCLERIHDQLNHRRPVPAQIVVGTKHDILNTSMKEEISQLSRLVRKQWRLPFLQLSAKWNCGVTEVFQHLLCQLDKELKKTALPPRRQSTAPQSNCSLM